MAKKKNGIMTVKVISTGVKIPVPVATAIELIKYGVAKEVVEEVVAEKSVEKPKLKKESK